MRILMNIIQNQITISVSDIFRQRKDGNARGCSFTRRSKKIIHENCSKVVPIGQTRTNATATFYTLSPIKVALDFLFPLIKRIGVQGIQNAQPAELAYRGSPRGHEALHDPGKIGFGS